jgi:hypothetical protein
MVNSTTYARLDGTATSLQVWRSDCATCGEQFEFMTTIKRRSLQYPIHHHRDQSRQPRGLLRR